MITNKRLLFTYLIITGLFSQTLVGTIRLPESMPTRSLKRGVAHYQDDQEFADKVRKYVERICSKQRAEAQRILKAIGTVHKHIKYDELKRILDDVAQVQVHVQGNAKDTAANEELRCALLLKVSVPLAEFVRKAILHTLNDLDKQIKYWEYQQSHSMSYFFHKSPLKWFNQRKQSQEILGNLRQLRYAQTEHFKMLGYLKIHLNAFDNNAAVSNQYTWLGQLLSLVHQLCTGKDLKVQEIASYNKLMPLMQRLLDRVEGHQDRVTDRVIGDAYKPNHLVRNWWKYSAGAAGALAAWYYGYHNQENREKITNVVTSFGKSFYEQVVTGPLEGARDVFLEKTKKPGDEKKPKDFVEGVLDKATKIAGGLNQQLDKFVSMFSPANDNNGEGQEDENNSSEAEAPDDTSNGDDNGAGNIREVFGRIRQSVGRIYTELKRDDEVVQVNRGWMSRGAASVFNWVGNSALNSRFPQQKRVVIQGEIDQLEPDVSELVQLLEEHGTTLLASSSNISEKVPEVVDGIRDGVEGVTDSLKQFIDEMRASLSDGHDIIKQQKATFALLRLVPLGALACGAGALLYKAYKTLRGKPNYEPIRTGLVDIAHLLNWYEDVQPNQMLAEDYGKLLYLGYRLKKEKRRVPEEKRNRFVNDINKLSSAWLTADKKMKVVDLMYKTYDFLTPTYVG